jgi:3-dehydroquinate synthase
MKSLHQTVRVEFRYDVHFTRNVFAPCNTTLRDVIASAGEDRRKVLVVLEDALRAARADLPAEIFGYARAHGSVMQLMAEPLSAPGGEAAKQTERHVDAIREAIHHYGICRHSFVIAIGGGALLDMAGYAAATAHRGVRLIRLPTTVLSQNDSGVGVKNAVNLFGKKNFVGTFAPPYSVINDLDFLDSLSDRDWRGGIAEAVKVALIKDAGFFEQLETLADALNRRSAAAMETLIYRCAELHLQHIAGPDPFELGSSRPLDFGHWAAHKLEQMTAYHLRHGEAVAIGIGLDSTYSYLTGRLPESHWQRIVTLLSALGFDLDLSGIPIGQLTEGLNEFREHLGGELTIVLLAGIGCGIEVHSMDREVIAQSAVLLSHSQAASAANRSK